MRRQAALTLVAAVALLGPVATADAAIKRCKPARDVPALDGSRYEGSDIFRIRARGASCTTARRVAVRSTLKGMRLGAFVLDYKWRRWSIRRDLMGPVDTYDAEVPDASVEKHVGWRFGSL